MDKTIKKILIVDDSSFMREVLKDLISNNFTDVVIHEAEDKPSALHKITQLEPDLVLLDIVMKQNELEGLEILEELRAKGVDANVIMLTSVGQTSVIERCKSLGAKHYIQKPFNTDEVVDAIKESLSVALE